MAIPILPESAPFSPIQRAWLNGFLAGVLNIDRSALKAAAPEPVKATPAAAAAPPAEEEFPWHEPTLSLDERLKLAEGKPFEHVLMASMAQLDCGSCGYVCQTYAEAIASGADTDLTKCSPGGKDTLKKLKELVGTRKALPVAATTGPSSNGSHTNGNGSHTNGNGSHASTGKLTFDRKNPFPAPFLNCVTLNRPGSEKDVRFVAINLKGSGLTYDVGDALGVYPENCSELVETVLKAMGARGDEIVNTPDGRQVYSYEALVRDFSITKVTESFALLLAKYASDPSEASTLQTLLDNDSAGVTEWWDILNLLEQFPSARPPIPEMIAALPPLQPRLYSISSSLKAHPEEVHLTVGVVKYTKSDRVRKGVASTYLTEMVKPRQRVKVFVHPSHGFRLPQNSDTPVIMVGPGTGIAPFRAFLEERQATGAKGKNWLFFGDQRQEFDFLYRDEMEGYLASKLLTRLDLAFSRNQKEKVYVQHRMQEASAELWKWLQDGAHFYVCGDARRMALDVDHMLHRVVETEGNMSAESAKEYVKQLSKAKRYQRDVY
jgi:sulfite reductase (NADPH) flavoprotein alpha-component